MKKKDLDVTYVEAIPADRSPLGHGIPAHARMEWRDRFGRRVIHFPDLSKNDVEDIAAMPDSPEDRCAEPDAEERVARFQRIVRHYDSLLEYLSEDYPTFVAALRSATRKTG